ncbi:MAG: protein-L-isoaspartate O-methyltransferase [Lautropia sp.]
MDIEQARFNMIEQQIRTWDVLDQDVLGALALVKREDFVPDAYRGMAFADVEIPLTIDGRATGQTMLSPKVEARMLQAIGLRKHEAVLEVGTGSGYGTALLAQRSRRISSWERDPALARFAAANLARAGITDLQLQTGDASQPPGSYSWDVIVLSGSVAQVPPHWLARLNAGGRLIAIVGDAPTMHARLYHRNGSAPPVATDLFETVAPRLAGFPAPERFRF